MLEQCLIEQIKKKDIDIEYFAKTILDDEDCRNEVIHYLLTNRDIMVYYHSYYIVSFASEIKPQLFYVYWDDFISLLSHKNSYHRDIGMTLIANLVSVDSDNKFDNIFNEYITHINDEKFMTAQCCIKNLKKIIQYRQDLIGKVVGILLEIDDITSYPEKQKELFKYGILDIFDMIYDKVKVEYKSKINFFIEDCLKSISPKTKKIAEKLRNKYL